jgi:N-succinyldiaminopimelate aminotransferase
MNPDLLLLQPYPFERLRQLLAANTPPAQLAHINLSIGEPKHATPALIFEALTAALPTLASYPSTLGTDALREAIAAWLARRHALPHIDPATQVMPVAGSREALFAFAQTVVDRTRPALVAAPNPFYQIYEGAALLAGAQPLFLPCTPENGFRMDFGAVDAGTWSQVQLIYVCSPGNPHGRVLTLPEWRQLFELADRHDFVIASDECYSEIYFDEAAPPLGGLQAAVALGRSRFERLVTFGSLSKRSNAPGLRSGFVAGDAQVLRHFFLYRTYHGTALGPAVQAASAAAWRDEAHVIENRRKYAAKFRQATPIVQEVLQTSMPDAAFYLWARTPIDDAQFARRLHAQCNVTVLPGSFLSRARGGFNPGAGFVRIALVAEEDEVMEAVRRIAGFCRSL